MALSIDDKYQNIRLIEKRAENQSDELRGIFPGRKICVCDFYVENCEDGQMDEDGVINYDGLLIIDHHAETPIMACHITSTQIAYKYATRERGPLNDDFVIIINHADADSILSALIMSGELDPEDDYVQAAIAADHTGEENIISDVLQSFEDDRKIEKSFEILQKVVEKRYKARKKLQSWVDNNQFKWDGGIAYITTDRKIDTSLAVPLLPDAEVILIASPMQGECKKRWRISIRLGKKAKGIELNKLDLPDFGGRWNAGSTSRHGGTDVEPEEYVKTLKRALKQE